jgi:hypothetical protein
MELVPATSKSVVFFTYSCGGQNQFQRQQKAWYSLLIDVMDGTNSNNSKKPGILYLFMWRMEPIQTTAKAWYSLLIHVEDETNSNNSKKGGILYLFIRRIEPISTTAKSMVFFTYSC